MNNVEHRTLAGTRQGKEVAMLILTRKRNATIRVGEDVVIHVIQTAKGSVKLGIDAPSHVRILRGELDVRSGASAEDCEPVGVGSESDADWQVVS
jgi:carbon storage regulator